MVSPRTLKTLVLLSVAAVSLASPLAYNPNCGQYDHPDDCAALTDLYHATNGTGWNPDHTSSQTWLSGKTICGGEDTGNWRGVTCSMKGRSGLFDTQCADISRWRLPKVIVPNEFIRCRVDKIDLFSQNLVGTIPESIGKLAMITSLNLGYNELTGAVPASLDKSGSLTFLRLDNNSLTSWGPNICPQLEPGPHGSQARLNYCELGNNNFACPVPECVKKYCETTCK